MTLRPTAYEMVLTSFLGDPDDHPALLAALQSWPRQLYDAQHVAGLLMQR